MNDEENPLPIDPEKPLPQPPPEPQPVEPAVPVVPADSGADSITPPPPPVPSMLAPKVPPPASTPPPASAAPSALSPEKKGGGCFKIGCLSCVALLLVVAISVGATWWWITRKEKFEPVILTQPEQVVLDTKLETIERISGQGHEDRSADLQGSGNALNIPPVVATDPAVNKAVVDPGEVNRTIVITQREMNSVFHKESELGEQFKILLVRDGIEVKMSLQLPEDSAILPGKNIRGRIGLYIALEKNTFVVRVDSISFGGIPVPTAWLEAAGIDKGTNIIEEFFGSAEVAEQFAAGIEEFDIKDGRILLRLAE